MDIQRAKELLEVLADGIDPLTGEVLPDDHVCNKGEIVRALNCAVEALSHRRKKPLPENAPITVPNTHDDHELKAMPIIQFSLQRRLLRTSFAVAAAKTSSVRPNAHRAVFDFCRR